MRVMIRIAVFILALLAGTAAQAQFRDSDWKDLNDSETVRSMKEQVAFLSSAAMEGRKAGSEGEKAAAIYITEQLRESGVDVLSGAEGDVFGIRQENGDTLTSRNVVGFIPGYDPELRDSYIVIGARMDNLGTSTVTVDGESREKIFYGANGNASGLSMLLQLARKLNTNSVLLKRSVLLVAFGASVDLGAGSWYFLNRSFPDVGNIDAMINLDMVGTGSNGFYAYTASNVDLNAMIEKLSVSLQPVQPEIVALEPVNSDHRMFYAKEIPSVFFTTGMYPWYNTDKDTAWTLEYEWMERELEYVYNFTLELVNGEAPDFRETDERGRRFRDDSSIVPYSECDVKPAFLGSTDPSAFLSKWVYVYLRYPQEAVDKGIQGRVLVNFVLDEKGRMTDVRVVRGVDELLDAEAVRVVSASPDWRPARVRGEKVKCEISIYVDFKLERR